MSSCSNHNMLHFLTVTDYRNAKRGLCYITQQTQFFDHITSSQHPTALFISMEDK